MLASLATSPSTLTGALEARDTRLMRDALRVLGAEVEEATPGRWTVRGPAQFEAGGRVDCGLAGTVLRFVPPLAALAPGRTEFFGDHEASRRPVGPLLDGLRQFGATVEGDALPFAVSGKATGGQALIDASASSQFVSGLLIAGAHFPQGVTVRHRGESVPSRPHIAMTIRMLHDRGVVAAEESPDVWRVLPGPVAPFDETIEPDLTNAAAFWAAGLISGGRVTVPGLRRDTAQPALALFAAFEALGGHVEWSESGVTVSAPHGIRGAALDLHEVSDATPVLAAVCALADGPSTIGGVAHIRGHETDRLAALVSEISGLGGRISETPDGLSIHPAPLTSGLFHTYADHRMAHAGALLGLAVPGLTLDDVSCTSKTIADFDSLWLSLFEGHHG